MSPQDLLLDVFCLVGDEPQALVPGRLRSRGPRPTLADSEALTIEPVGEFWKSGTGQDLFRHSGWPSLWQPEPARRDYLLFRGRSGRRVSLSW
jgi:hypothetical protein